MSAATIIDDLSPVLPVDNILLMIAYGSRDASEASTVVRGDFVELDRVQS